MSNRHFGKDAGLKNIDAQARLERFQAFVDQNMADVEENISTESFPGIALSVKRNYVGVLISTTRRMANGLIGLMQGTSARFGLQPI